MKIIYCTHSVCNPGGMERVLCNKVTWLVAKGGYEVMVVTTDQHGRPPFYPFPEQVKMVDLGVNYSDDNRKGTVGKILGYLRRKMVHRKSLKRLMIRENPEIVVSLYPSESSFIPRLHDGSRKVLELHYNRYFRLQYARHGILGMIDRFRTWQDVRIAGRFDRFVVLTEEDREYWGDMPNMRVIPNAVAAGERRYADVLVHRVLAVGRLDYQKGFDRLLDAWGIVAKQEKYSDWKLDIFGRGEWQEMLQDKADASGIGDSVRLHAPVSDIWSEYAGSSMLVMSSNYEGFPMVMIEAMSCGLPVVSFDCCCGPRDIISDGENGLLVKNGDIEGLAAALMRLMDDEGLRRKMSAEARKVALRYSESQVMEKWTRLFEELVK